MDAIDLENKAITENKVTKPSDNVLTPDQTPSYESGIRLVVFFLAINFFIAAIYYGIINP